MTRGQRAAVTVTLLALVTGLGMPVYRGDLAVSETSTALVRSPLAPICVGFAAATAGTLHLAGVAVARHGATLRHPDGFAIEITSNCTGWFHGLLFLTGLLAFRPEARQGRGILRIAIVGVGLLAAVNLARLVLVYLAGTVSPQAFEWSHHVAGEALLAGTVLLLWWRAGAPRAAADTYSASQVRICS